MDILLEKQAKKIIKNLRKKYVAQQKKYKKL